MKTGEMDFLALYGRKDIFKRKLKQGYTRVAFGKGDLVDEERMVLWAFSHPEGDVCTYEFRKLETPDGRIFHEMPSGARYASRAFQEYVQRHRLLMGPWVSLQEFIQKWTARDIFSAVACNSV